MTVGRTRAGVRSSFLARNPMSGFVVCPNCGARIKAGRGHCLRCFETLPVEGAEEAPQAWYHRSKSRKERP